MNDIADILFESFKDNTQDVKDGPLGSALSSKVYEVDMSNSGKNGIYYNDKTKEFYGWCVIIIDTDIGHLQYKARYRSYFPEQLLDGEMLKVSRKLTNNIKKHIRLNFTPMFKDGINFV